MIVVAVAMLGSLTVLPALLSKLGDRVEKGRIPFLGRLRREAARTGSGRAILTPGAAAAGRRRSSPPAACCSRWRCRCCTIHTAQSGLDALPKSIATVPTIDRIQKAFPGRRDAGARRDQGERRLRRGQGRGRRAEAAALASRSDDRPDRGRRQRRPHRRPASRSRSRATAPTRRRPARCTTLRDTVAAGDGRPGPGRDLRGHRRHGRLGRREHAAQALGPARVRVRAHVRVPPAARLVPLDRDRGQGDRPQPAVGRRRLRRARGDLPVRLGREPPGLPAPTAASRSGCRSSCS